MNRLPYFISLLSTIFTLVVSNVWALPNCPYKGTAYWTNCQGTYTNANGNKYVGEWQNDKWHGQGIRNLANGDKYVGEFKNGKKHGQGTYTYINGNKYVGEWKNDKIWNAKMGNLGKLCKSLRDKYTDSQKFFLLIQITAPASKA